MFCRSFHLVSTNSGTKHCFFSSICSIFFQSFNAVGKCWRIGYLWPKFAGSLLNLRKTIRHFIVGELVSPYDRELNASICCQFTNIMLTFLSDSVKQFSLSYSLKIMVSTFSESGLVSL